MNVFEKIEQLKIIPVIALDIPEKAVDVGEALINGGLECAEITFRTEGADIAIASLVKKHPNMLVGAGTVLTTNQADSAVNAGASFVVSPGLNPYLVEHCLKHNITIIPGIATASEIEMAIHFGLNVVKFFPASILGGVKMIKALSGPFPNIKFLPTGGISKENLLEFINCKQVIACGGSWMVKKDLIINSEFDKITELTSEAVKIIQ